MKVLLINPPDFNLIKTNIPNIVVEESGLYPPLGLMYVASYAMEHSDNEIIILDSQAEKINYETIEERIRSIKPDLVGIQVMSFTLLDAILTAKVIKKVNKEIKVVLGGPHVNIFPDETIRLAEVDFLVLGEGEYAFTELIETIKSRQNLLDVEGIVYKEGDQIIKTPSRQLIGNLDIISMPRREALPYKKYYSVLAKHSPITTMMSSRGCPYKCIFCNKPYFGRIFRARSAESVVMEMEKCFELGIKEIFFYDDTFNINKERVLRICELIISKDLKINWDIRARINEMDERILKKLKEAGCLRIHYGVESGVPEILKALRKDLDIAKVKEVFKITKDLGITTLGYFMIGNPTETKRQILKTIDFAKKLNLDFVHFSVATPFPGTDLYAVGLEKKILKYDYWKEFSKNPVSGFTPYIWEEILDRQELFELLRYAYKSFYLRPNHIIEMLFKVRSLEELLIKTRAGLKFLKY